MELIDRLHCAGIGVILDWVPSHFPSDEFALGRFDGTHLFEHADPRLGFHPDWKSLIFNYGRHEVRSFLASSAEHWLSRYHADGLRVDAVASMVYLDYSRSEGEWLPNVFGGRENLEAIEFLRQLNTGIYADHPDVQVIAEESTAFPGISRPVHLGGIGFGLKWDLGWMHDTLAYFSRDPIYRRHHHDELTFRSIYAFSENFMLRFLTTRSCTERARWPGKCLGTTGKSLRTCGCSMGTSSHNRVRSSSSWATRSRNGANGTTRQALTGTSWTIQPTKASADGSLTSTRCTAAVRHFTSATPTPQVSPGHSRTTPARACSVSYALATTARPCWSCATSLRCPATTSSRGCRWEATGANCSTATPSSTEVAASATSEV